MSKISRLVLPQSSSCNTITVQVITVVRSDDCTVFQVAGKPGDVRQLRFETQLGKEATSNMSLLSSSDERNAWYLEIGSAAARFSNSVQEEGQKREKV